MKKKNFLEKILDRKKELSFKQLGLLIILCLGIGSLATLISVEIGALLIALMLFLVISKILLELFS